MLWFAAAAAMLVQTDPKLVVQHIEFRPGVRVDQQERRPAYDLGGTLQLFVRNETQRPFAPFELRINARTEDELLQEGALIAWRVEPSVIPAGGIGVVSICGTGRLMKPDAVLTVRLFAQDAGLMQAVALNRQRCWGPQPRIVRISIRQGECAVFLRNDLPDTTVAFRDAVIDSAEHGSPVPLGGPVGTGEVGIVRIPLMRPIMPGRSAVIRVQVVVTSTATARAAPAVITLGAVARASHETFLIGWWPSEASSETARSTALHIGAEQTLLPAAAGRSPDTDRGASSSRSGLLELRSASAGTRAAVVPEPPKPEKNPKARQAAPAALSAQLLNSLRSSSNLPVVAVAETGTPLPLWADGLLVLNSDALRLRNAKRSEEPNTVWGTLDTSLEPDRMFVSAAQCLASGVRGIVWRGPRPQAQGAEEIRRINRRLKALGSLLQNSEPAAAARAEGAFGGPVPSVSALVGIRGVVVILWNQNSGRGKGGSVDASPSELRVVLPAWIKSGTPFWVEADGTVRAKYARDGQTMHFGVESTATARLLVIPADAEVEQEIQRLLAEVP